MKKEYSLIKIIKTTATYILLIILSLFSFYILDIGCIIRYIFHICCPTCGMTRAMMELFKGDFNAYILYNALALPVFIAVLCLMSMSIFNKKNTIIKWICISVLILNLIYYFIRIFFQILPC